MRKLDAFDFFSLDRPANAFFALWRCAPFRLLFAAPWIARRDWDSGHFAKPDVCRASLFAYGRRSAVAWRAADAMPSAARHHLLDHFVDLGKASAVCSFCRDKSK
jgi:hypothetical protein